jgi:hypothetical protein
MLSEIVARKTYAAAAARGTTMCQQHLQHWATLRSVALISAAAPRSAQQHDYVSAFMHMI